MISAAEVVAIQAQVRAVKIEDSLRDYLLGIVTGTRESRRLRLGASPRAAGALQRAAQSHAFLDGRDYVVDGVLVFQGDGSFWLGLIGPNGSNPHRHHAIAHLHRCLALKS